MLIIQDVLMKKDNIAESVDLLEDNLVRNIAVAFPNLDAMRGDERHVVTLAIVAHIVSKTDVDYADGCFRDTKRFDLVTSLVGNALCKEINEKVPMERNLFMSLFTVLMEEKFGYLFNKRDITRYPIDGKSSLPEALANVVEKTKGIYVNAVIRLRDAM